MTQLARVIQKLGANPPQDSDKEWTAKLWEVQGRLKKVWNGSSPNVTEARSRIAPLNILGVLTMEVVLRTWIEASPTDKSEKQNALLADMDQTAIPSQRETLSLVMGTALEDGYDFDIYYDLARMQAVRLLIKSNGSLPSASDFSEIRLNLEKAREAATDTQRKAAVDSLRTFPGFELFGNASCEDFAKSLGR